MTYMLKGDPFANRYRITGKLKTLSPLHIGTGEESDALFSASEQEAYRKDLGKVPLVSMIAKDHRGKPLIPGSALRGVMRHWLLDVLAGIGTEWANTRDYSDEALLDLAQPEQIAKAKNEFSLLEVLFGTPFNAGKIEVWDATCLTEDFKGSDLLLHWNSRSLTYVDTSVAIDPATGTALEGLLYKAEIVPPGVVFELNIVGQNLSDEELGVVLLALQGFNSSIFPILLGARNGRGYGRVQYMPGEVYRIDQSSAGSWITATIESLSFKKVTEEPDDGSAPGTDAAGYFNLPKLNRTEQQELIKAIKSKLIAKMKE